MTHLELGQISSKTVEDNGEEKEYYVDQHELPRYFIDSDIKWKHILLLKNIVKADEDFAINQTLCRAMAGPRLLSVLGYGSTKWNLQLFGQKVFAEYRSKGEKKKKKNTLTLHRFVCLRNCFLYWITYLVGFMLCR